jgi:EAL domain-containing protein (putative c-di-GMP-specific phosphodiesterase class I)
MRSGQRAPPDLPEADPTRTALPRPEVGVGPPPRFRLTPDGRADAADRRRMQRDLATATRERQFVLHYLPRLALGSLRPAGAEALIRWPQRKHGLVSAGVFMPLAERGGQAVEICAWTLSTACGDAAAWPADCNVSVSIAAHRIEAAALLAQVAGALEGSGLRAERLEIGLGEALLLDTSDDTYLALSALRDLGVGVALDDFGTGVASLALLRRLPLTALKLDRSLIRDLPDDREGSAIVRATIETGHALGLTVVAEGIESEPHRAFLECCGCDQGQGALFGHALTAEQILARLAG